MSRTKDAWQPSRASGRAWADASSRHPCPVCASDSWCQIARDGATVLCKRVESPHARVNRGGVLFFIHHLGGALAAPPRPAEAPPAPSAERAPARVLDDAHRALLAALTLDACDRDALRARGLDAATIAAAGYRTLRVEGRAALARAVLDDVGATYIAAIPGIVRRTEGERSWWSLSGAAGLLVPVRDPEGYVVALKVRRRDPDDGARYLFLSSHRHGGLRAAFSLHVPVAARALWEQGTRELVITEGELKADVATALLSRPVVSVPGVGAWAHALPLVDAWQPAHVAVAFDADARTNHTVAQAQRDLVAALRQRGFSTALWTWDQKIKGLDDCLNPHRKEAHHGV